MYKKSKLFRNLRDAASDKEFDEPVVAVSGDSVSSEVLVLRLILYPGFVL